MITVYGIPNCSTVKKATEWLRQNNIAFVFHDYKKQGIERGKLEQWAARFGKDQLVNTRGTTWRGLSDAEKQQAATQEGALTLLQAKPSLIKRPLVEKDGKAVCVGFDAPAFEKTLG